ncbi:MAG: plasmid pRiA4b ORF-3 family protein [Chloroflexi bacterium]|nr:plasmid pRiA4b ORF-3 family protein [Chloroflexota bacterium]
MVTETGKVYDFGVSLREVEPPIWRAIQVPGGYSFWDLHVAIQDAMGWEDSHLHEFEIIDPATRHIVRISVPDGESIDQQPTRPGWEMGISDYLTMDNAEAHYAYDFGDGWVHRVTLKEVLDPDPAATYPMCVAGERACPPEDCGGPGGGTSGSWTPSRTRTMTNTRA